MARVNYAAFRTILNVGLVASIVLCGIALWKNSLPDTLSLYETPFSHQNQYAFAQQRAGELDRKYVPGLMSQIGSMYDETDGDYENLTAAIVIGRLSNESDNIRWVYDELNGIEDRQIYVVDDASISHLHLDKNHGREAAVYLTHIVNNYDNLTNITFFWHGAKVVWHNNLLLDWDSSETINKMDRRNILRRGYVPSRCDQWPGCPNWIKFNPSRAEHRLDPHRLEEMFTHDLFAKLFPDADTFPPYFAGTCCSQFALSRQAIRNRPLSLYQRLLDWVLEFEDDESSGRVMEYLWQYLFLGQGTLCPSMRDCYCATYNLCLEDQRDIRQLENWNSQRTRREEMQWQVNFVERTMTTRAEQMKAQNATKEEVSASLELLRPEYERLSRELDRLSETTWLEREKIIHRWKLSVPPVGW